MAINYVEALGLLGGTLTTVSLVPQIVKIYRRKSAADLSWLWIICFVSGVILWLAYGLLSGSVPVMVANGVSSLLGIWLAIVKFWYDRHDGHRSKASARL